MALIAAPACTTGQSWPGPPAPRSPSLPVQWYRAWPATRGSTPPRSPPPSPAGYAKPHPPEPRLPRPPVAEVSSIPWEQILLIPLVLKRPWLSHQPFDDVPVIDAMLAPPAQPRQVFHLPLPIPDLHMVQVQPRFDPLADQPAVHRIAVALDMDQTARVHLHPLPFGRFHAPRRQFPHHREFFGQPGPAPRIPLREQVLQKLRVLGHASKVAAPTQRQRLLHRPLEPVVALFRIPVLVWARRVGVPRLHPVIL